MSQGERTELVVDETTIYEIDLECQKCREKEKPAAKEWKPACSSERSSSEHDQ